MTETRLHSPIHRARLLVVSWLETLPENFRNDAIAALDRLCATAEREIVQAYWDGCDQYKASESIRAMIKEKVK